MPTVQKELTYKVIEKEMLRRILEGVYSPGQQLPTERELERELEVSRLTIAKGLANLAAAGYITRTQGRGSFVCPQLPQAQRIRYPAENVRHGIVKFISPANPENQVTVRRGVLEGLHDAVTSLGYHVSVEFYDSVEQQMALLENYRDPINEGFVIWPAQDARLIPYLQRMQEDHFAFVLIDAFFPEFNSDYIISDNSRGAELMINHLVGAGHRRIAYFTVVPDRVSTSDRLAGVFAAMSKHHIPITTDTINIIPNNDPVVSNYSSAHNTAYLRARLEQLLQLSEPPTALFASNDSIAMALYAQLEILGVKVPDRMAVAGFDNIDAAQYFKVPLTTVAQDFYGVGQAAGRVIVMRREQSPVPGMRFQNRVAPELIVRDSVQSSNKLSMATN